MFQVREVKEICKSSNESKDFKTVIVMIFLLAVFCMEVRSLWRCIAYLFSDKSIEVILILKNMRQIVEEVVIKREFIIDDTYLWAQTAISIVASLLVIYFVVGALELLWSFNIKELGGVFENVAGCFMLWMIGSILIVFMDFFVLSETILMRIAIVAVFLILMTFVFHRSFARLIKSDISFNVK